VKPLVSILIPAYNSERWIADTIASALEQTWPRKEIIIVDDGSTDRTLEVATRFASAAVSVHTQPNQGAAAARNKALSLCQGDYVQWLDADDLLAPEKLALQMQAAELAGDPRLLLAGSWAYFMFRPRKAVWTPGPFSSDLTPLEWMLMKFECAAFLQTSTWLVSRELTEAAGPWDTRLTLDDDGEYFARVLLRSKRVELIPQARVFYRISGVQSLSYMGRNDAKLNSQFLSMRLQIEHLRAREDSERVRKACLKFLQDSLIYFYPERPDLLEQARLLAAGVNGTLSAPQLPWKYSSIQKLFGWVAAKKTQREYNQLKWTLLRSWDRILSRLETRTQREASPVGTPAASSTHML
jgi:glycosyltransferase involved in cell wall biosynthesis